MVNLFMIKRRLSKSRSLFLDQGGCSEIIFFIIKVEVAPIKWAHFIDLKRTFYDLGAPFKIEVTFFE